MGTCRHSLYRHHSEWSEVRTQSRRAMPPTVDSRMWLGFTLVETKLGAQALEGGSLLHPKREMALPGEGALLRC